MVALDQLEAELFSLLVCKVDRVLINTNLSVDRLTDIFHCLKTDVTTELQCLRLWGCESLSQVDPVNLAEALVRVKEVDLGYSRITEEQLAVLFRTIGEREDLQLEDLDVWGSAGSWGPRSIPQNPKAMDPVDPIALAKVSYK